MDINIKLNNREDIVVIALFIFILFSNTFTSKLTEGAFEFSLNWKAQSESLGQTCYKETQDLSHDVLMKLFLQCFDFYCWHFLYWSFWMNKCQNIWSGLIGVA